MSDDRVMTVLARLEGKLDERLGTIDGRFDRIDERLEGVDARLGKIDGRLDGIDERFERLEDGQTRLRVNLMERMDRLQEQLQAIDGLLTMGLGHADEAQEQARAAVESNRIHVEQIRTLRDLYRKLDSRVRQLEEKR